MNRKIIKAVIPRPKNHIYVKATQAIMKNQIAVAAVPRSHACVVYIKQRIIAPKESPSCKKFLIQQQILEGICAFFTSISHILPCCLAL